MTIKEIAKRIDKTKETEALNCALLREFQIFEDLDREYAKNDKLKAYWLMEWYESVSYASGTKLYLLDGIPVAYGVENTEEENFEWCSDDAFYKTKEYIMTLFAARPLSYKKMKETEISPFFKVNSYDMLLDEHKENAYYKKTEKVKIVSPVLMGAGQINDKALILFVNGKHDDVYLSCVYFKLNLIDEAINTQLVAFFENPEKNKLNYKAFWEYITNVPYGVRDFFITLKTKENSIRHTDEVQKLANILLDKWYYFHQTHSHTGDSYSCRWCSHEPARYKNYTDIIHGLNCPVLVAKDLLTKGKKEKKDDKALTFSKWLEEKPVEFQKELLGLTRYKAWKSGDIKTIDRLVDRFTDNKNRIRTLDQLNI